MRDIEFRAVSQLDGNWVYGSLIKYEYKRPNMEDLSKPQVQTSYDICRKESDWCFSYKNVPVFEETIGQYTGLTDKKGRKIFEGDIVYDSYREYSYLVTYWLGQGMYFLDKINDRCGNWYSFEDVDFSENIEVIGNIHDNPELLEEV